MRHTTSSLVHVRRTAASLLAVVGIFLGSLEADIVGPSAHDRHIAKWVANLLREEHLLKQPLDDKISDRALTTYMRLLDPLKSYFLQSDMDEFRAYQYQLDDLVKNGDVSPAYAIYNRLLKRSDMVASWIDALVMADHDFTADEVLVTDPEIIEYAKTEDELKERWRRRIKYELLRQQADDMTEDEAREKIKRRFRSVSRSHHQTNSDELLEIFLSSITSSFDPHTSYMAKSSLENFEINMRLNLEGIGAALKPEDGYTVVTKVIPGGAADKHGKLKPEDKIISVGQGESGEMVDVVDMKLGDVVDMIRGHAGTVVRLGVIPSGETASQIYAIRRARVELKDSEARAEILDIPETELLGEPTPENGRTVRVGVIDLPSFYMDMEGARQNALNYKSSTRDVARILEDFRAKGVEVVVLDLSRNGGGSLTEAVDLTGLFIDRGPVVQIKDSDGMIQQHNDETPGAAWNGPLVVQISKFSASASEILAGAIQDYQRGIVVGDEASHGKGTVQSLQDLGSRVFNVPDPPNYGALKITMQQFYRPNGDSTQKRGVLSDVVLPSLTSQMDVGEADEDYAVEFDQIQPARFGKFDRANPDVIRELRRRSLERIAKNDEFARLRRDIDRYREQKDRQEVTLNAEEFHRQRDELNAEKEEEKQFEKQMDATERAIYPRDFYNNEVLAIAVDYLRMLEASHVVQAR